ncbi:Rrf2 family transcriptional regulator [bacterium]|nr:Rrf2 family transcriptional regulator [bacterium]
MFTLSRQTEYALFLINFLKKKSVPVSLGTISNQFGFSRQFLGRVAGKLKEAGILASKEGKRGGFWLRKDPEKISLGEIISLFEGEKRIVSCLKKNPPPGCLPHCRLRAFWRRLEKSFYHQLQEIKLGEIL